MYINRYIKICGIQTQDEALLCSNAGCTAVGFLLALTHKAEDKTTPEVAREIINKLPAEVEKVMVTHSPDACEIARIANFTGVSAVQLHGDMPEKEIGRVKALLPGLPLIKAIHIEDDRDTVLSYARQMSRLVDRLLLDSRTVDRLGGTGKTHDWLISKEVVRQMAIPVILAGGLTPGNVSQAIEQVNPFGVDVNSGVENQNGYKDALKIKTFVALARKYL